MTKKTDKDKGEVDALGKSTAFNLCNDLEEHCTTLCFFYFFKERTKVPFRIPSMSTNTADQFPMSSFNGSLSVAQWDSCRA